MTNKRAKLAVNNATKWSEIQTGGLPAQERVTPEVEDGQFVSILGPSGCGKAAPLWSIDGLHTPNSRTNNVEAVLVSVANPQIGIMFHEANLLLERAVDRIIEFTFKIRAQKPACDKLVTQLCN